MLRLAVWPTRIHSSSAPGSASHRLVRSSSYVCRLSGVMLGCHISTWKMVQRAREMNRQGQRKSIVSLVSPQRFAESSLLRHTGTFPGLASARLATLNLVSAALGVLQHSPTGCRCFTPQYSEQMRFTCFRVRTFVVRSPPFSRYTQDDVLTNWLVTSEPSAVPRRCCVRGV